MRPTGRARVPQRITLVPALPAGDGPGPVVELLHPGSGEAFTGPHRHVEGGLLTADGALLVLPGLLAVAEAGAALWLARRDEAGGVRLLAWRQGRLQPLRTLACSGLHLGGQWLLAWRGANAWAEQVEDGAPVPLPMGAREAHARPWPDAAGASWADGRALVEQAGEGPPRVVGVATEPLRRPRIGPRGAAVAAGAGSTWVHAPGRGLLPLALDEAPGEVAFSPDGARALVETEEGVLLVDLAAGCVLEGRREGRPAGFGWWVDPAGERRRWRVEEGGADLPGPGVVLAGRLHGPGGLCWDLRTGAPTGPAETSGADLVAPWGAALALVEDQVVLRRHEGHTTPLLALPEGEDALALAALGDLCAVRTVGGVACGGADPSSWRWQALPRLPGAPLLARDGPTLVAPAPGGALGLPDFRPVDRWQPLPSPALPPLAAGLGLPLDGATPAPDGSLWAWQDDGLLLRLRAASG